MRSALASAVALSLVAHGAIAAYFFVPRGATETPALDRDPPPQNAGETFELPAPESADTPLANASPSPDTNAESAPVEVPDAPARPTPPSKAKQAARPSHQGRPSAGHAPPGQGESTPGSTGSAALFGAVGDRSAADLATVFTRDFAQAASGDPAWRTVPLGAAGDATLVMTLDDSGHLADVQILGTASEALVHGIRQTMTLIKGRSFVSHSKVTKLRVSGSVTSVSSDTVHDGLHGEAFAIHGSYTNGEGLSFFALPIGRRIELRVRLLLAE